MAGVAGLVAGVAVYLVAGRHRLAWAAAAYFAVGLVVYELAYW